MIAFLRATPWESTIKILPIRYPQLLGGCEVVEGVKSGVLDIQNASAKGVAASHRNPQESSAYLLGWHMWNYPQDQAENIPHHPPATLENLLVTPWPQRQILYHEGPCTLLHQSTDCRTAPQRPRAWHKKLKISCHFVELGKTANISWSECSCSRLHEQSSGIQP